MAPAVTVAGRIVWPSAWRKRRAGCFTPLSVCAASCPGKSATNSLNPPSPCSPTLATVFAGSNDILERGFDPGRLRANLERMMGALVSANAVVLTFTLPDLAGVMPIGRFLASRVRAMNDSIRAAAASTGARLVDFAAYPVGSDPRLWSEDRFHVNAEGHARIAAALAQALGLPGTDDAWQQPLPTRNPSNRWARIAESWSWYRNHLFERIRPGNPLEHPCRPKRPQLEPVQI